MRIAAPLLLAACLAGCNSLPTASEGGFLDTAAWRQRQAIKDANAIVQGMHEARTQSESLAGRTPVQSNIP